MPESKPNSRNQGIHHPPHLIYGVFFTIIAIVALVALIVVSSQADDTSQTAAVTPDAPTVDSVTIAATSQGGSASAISLTENTTSTVYIYGTVSDNNGCEEIDDADGGASTWAVAFYRTDVTDGATCTPSNADCYQDTEIDADITNCTPGGGDLTVDYEMDIDVYYYADATDAGSSPDHSATTWTANVSVTDDDGQTGTASATTELNTLKAINVESSIDYGTVALGADSAEQDITITNTGNDNDLDPTIEQASDWSCTVGTIAVSYLHWNTTAAQSYWDGTTTTNSGVDLSNMSILKATTTVHSSADDVYTILRLPTTGVGGSCTSVLTFTAA